MSNPKQLPRRFSLFLLAQSLGAFNDNLFKMLLQLYILQILVAQNAENLISQATFLFTAPFVLFGPWAGYFADRFAKVDVMRIVKFVEILVMLFGALAFYVGDINILMMILFLMATQSAFFGPAKYGYIPESCLPETVTRANSLVSMSVFVAIIFGNVCAGALLVYHDNNALFVSFYLIFVAIIGSLFLLFIEKGKPGVATQPFPWNPLSGILKNLIFLKQQKKVFLAGLAESYFWMLGLLFQTNILLFAKDIPSEEEAGSILLSLLPALLGVGIAAGSLLASRWSGQKVELGLTPFGGFGLAFCAIALYFTDNYTVCAIILFFAGIFGGLFVVPLYAYIQFHAKANEKGRTLATVGILNGFFLVGGAALYYLFAVALGLSPATIYLILGIKIFVVVWYIWTIIPEYYTRFMFWLLTHTLYNIKIVGGENVPFRGAALFAPNHVTFVDAFLLNATVQRFIRFVMYQAYYDLPVLNRFFKLMSVIPINADGGAKAIVSSLREARKQLLDNHTVCIFPEGELTRSGEINEFHRGFETVMKGVDCPIIPVYMHNLWGSIFSRSGGKVIFKLPKAFSRRVTVYFGKPMPSNTKAPELEAAVRALQKLAGETSG